MIVYMLAKYGPDKQLVGRRLLPGLDPQIIRRLYALAETDPVAGSYPIDAANRDLFELMTGEPIELEGFSYVIEAETANDNDLG